MNRKSDCCGCTACLHACPAHCITMREDEEGFLYPAVEREKCIHCRRCETVCPMRNSGHKNTGVRTCVGYCRDGQIRQQSSSGGFFSIIADWILQQNGVVFGAAFDEGLEVHHIAVQSREQLAALRGSKYLQSRMEDAYPQARRFLEEGRRVLFTGTACQIAGLKNYLGKEYEHLYTMDVLCHGVPSPKIWRLYLETKRKEFHAPIKRISFRSKEKGWKNYCVRMEFPPDQSDCVPFGRDPFMAMFLSDLDLRPSCYACPFKALPRASDISAGDCWGVENVLPEMDDDKGTSVILLHSPKGEALFQAVRGELVVREAETDRVLPPTADSRKSVAPHPNRKKFWAAVRRGEGFDALCGYVPKSLPQKMAGALRYWLQAH